MKWSFSWYGKAVILLGIGTVRGLLFYWSKFRAWNDDIDRDCCCETWCWFKIEIFEILGLSSTGPGCVAILSGMWCHLSFQFNIANNTLNWIIDRIGIRAANINFANNTSQHLTQCVPWRFPVSLPLQNSANERQGLSPSGPIGDGETCRSASSIRYPAKFDSRSSILLTGHLLNCGQSPGEPGYLIFYVPLSNTFMCNFIQGQNLQQKMSSTLSSCFS